MKTPDEWPLQPDDAQKQAESLPYMKLMAIALLKFGATDITLTEEDIARAEGQCLVVGPNPSPDVLRFQVLPQEEADRVLHDYYKDRN